MTTPDQSPRLSSLAHRVAWGRLLPGVALLVVGLSQPVLSVPGVDDTVRTLTLLNIVTTADDVLQDATFARTLAVLLLVAALGAVVVSFVAMENRSNASRIGVLVFAVSTALLVPMFAVIGANSRSDAVQESAGVVAAGMLPLLVGAAMTWVAAAGTQDSGRLLRGGAPDS